MAEVQQSSGNGKGKNHQKKMTIRVDFTPMVDMNMLLITFFMLCTTMIKSQTLNISLPSNQEVQNEEQMTKVNSDEAVTIILDAKRKPGYPNQVDSVDHKVVTEVFYYLGKPMDGQASPGANGEYNNLKQSAFLADKNGKPNPEGIRKLIQDRNKDVHDKIVALKKEYKDGKFGNMEIKAEREKARKIFQEKALAIAADSTLKRPAIIIKCTPQASYGSLVEILDEMQINSVSRYTIENMTRVDSVMLIDYRNRHH